ncbi:hypothetical protein FQN57_000349 [Myotisia sp. PD_48]|nr:hypothetical protein FQN57_000349 [Myotisia sp. PD_48]
MGTRGLRIVRYHGRYYTYYNHWDSYPSGLGNLIVDKIPLDPEKYQSWLKRQRDLFAELASELEENVLTVPIFVEENEDVSDGDNEEQDSVRARQALAIEVFVSNNDLERFPCVFNTSTRNLFIEWTYLVDLDNELFTVNSKTHFYLSNIPQSAWDKALRGKSEEDEMRTVYGFPHAFRRLPKARYFATDEDCNKFSETFTTYKSSFVKVREDLFPIHPKVILSMTTLKNFLLLNHSLFSDQLHSWNQDDFIFREHAYALLSIATSNYHFDQPQRLLGTATNGYLVYPNTTNSQRSNILPVFPMGFHPPDREPGSCPSQGIFWFNHVLVSLVPVSVLEDDSESAAAISHAVEFGRAEGKRYFNVLIFSIDSAIMVHVKIDSSISPEGNATQAVSVERTEPLEILPEFLRNEYLGMTYADFFMEHKGFLALVRFFECITVQHLRGYSHGSLPTEIYDGIIAAVDDHHTALACSQVSTTFYHLSKKYFIFADGISVTDCFVNDNNWKEPIITYHNHEGKKTMAACTSKSVPMTSPYHLIIGQENPSMISELRYSLRNIEFQKCMKGKQLLKPH